MDVYRGVAPPQRSPVRFALYIINFPQLIAGPIVRYRPISAQLDGADDDVRRFRDRRLRFAIGLAKKLLIADPIGAVADHLFALPPADLPVGASGSAVVCYAMQIYFDFSGYSDMAIGLARMFGFRFPENFNYPYPRSLDPGILAALAHDAVGLVPRLRLHSARRQPRRPGRTARNLLIVFLLCGRGTARAGISSSGACGTACSCRSSAIGVVARTLDRTPRVSAQRLYARSSCWSAGCSSAALTLDQALDMLTRMFGLQRDAETMLSLSSNVAAPTMALIVAAACFAIRSGRACGT